MSWDGRTRPPLLSGTGIDGRTGRFVVRRIEVGVVGWIAEGVVVLLFAGVAVGVVVGAVAVVVAAIVIVVVVGHAVGWRV